jgi:hypothetical protein
VKLGRRFTTVVEEIPMQLPRISVRSPTGRAFEVPDLLMLRAWCDFHDLRLAIELDVQTDRDEYEELLGLYDRTGSFRRWILWRSHDGIVAQAPTGRAMLFDRMADALERLIPLQD